MKIVIANSFNFSEDQKARLKNVGDVSVLPDVDSAEDWLKTVEGADVICSDGSYLLENLYELKNVFVTYPYIELGAFDSEKLAANGVSIANTRGSNRDSIVEWVMFMVLALFRKFPVVLNTPEAIPFNRTQSLVGQKALIIGHGDIGSQVGLLCEAFGMEADYFNRGDDLLAKSASKNVVINCLNCNSTSKNLLDAAFFGSLSTGTYFVSFVRQYTYDLSALISALDTGTVAGAAIDCDPEAPFGVDSEFYQTVLKHEKILATPHVAFATVQAGINGTKTVVENVENFAVGKPHNALTKK